MIFNVFFVYSCIFLFRSQVNSERTKDKIYTHIDASAYCFRRLNGTHEFGCTSSRNGDVGVIHIIEGDLDIDWLWNKSNAGPYMGVLKPTLFYNKKEELVQLKDAGKLSGIALISHPNESNNITFSTEDTCPNRYSGLEECSEANAWNPVGNAMNNVDWGIPIIFIDSEPHIEAIKECFQKYNNESRDTQYLRSLCSLEIKSHMLAAVDSQTCIRRNRAPSNIAPIKFCDPLGDRNVFSTLYLTHPNQSIILLTTRLDTSSLFDGIMPGVVSPVTSIVTMLTVASLLKQLPSLSNNETNILFGFFNGESYDYIGSSRFIYDTKHGLTDFGSSKLTLDRIKLLIELDQITGNELFVHSRSNTSQVETFIDYTKNVPLTLNTNFKRSIGPLPPSSLQTFVKEKNSMEGVVISSYDRKYTSRVYHSVYDNAANLGYKYRNGSAVDGDIQDIIANVSVSLTKVLCYYLLNNDCDKITWDLETTSTRVDELFHCYVDTLNCSIFREVTNKQPLSDRAIPLYVGVNVHNNTITTLTGYTLAYFTGDVVDNRNESYCVGRSDDLECQYIWMTGENSSSDGVCVKTTLNFTLAVSPAFDVEDYDWESNQYSTWTESIWRNFSSRIFLKPPLKHEIFTVSIGTIVLILSFLLVFFVNSKAEVIFNNNVIGGGG